MKSYIDIKRQENDSHPQVSDGLYTLDTPQ